MTVLTELAAGRQLVDREFFARLSARIAAAHPVHAQLADRIADQTLAYLAACAQRAPGSGTLSPAPLVDLGWHAFLEYTLAYDAFFQAHGWAKVHHYPHDVPGRVYEPASVVLERTRRAIEHVGLRVDAELWEADRVSCGGDDSDGEPGDPLPCGDHG
jgi:hypothetical protein